MKISHLVLVLLVLCLGGAGLYYSLEQQKEYELIVALHGGGPQIEDADAQGLRKESKALTSIQATLAESRSKALAEAKASKITMRDMRATSEETGRQLEEANQEIAAQEKRYTAAQEKLKKIADSIAAAAEQASQSSLKIEPDASLPDIVEAIKQEVTRLTNEQKELAAEKEDLATLLAAAREKVAKEEVELANLRQQAADTRKRFIENEDEYSVAAVDNRWNFVVINIGPNSSLGVGDDNQLIVKRDGNSIARLRVVSIDGGQVVADFDPAQLKKGQRIEIGDRAIRVKPFGD